MALLNEQDRHHPVWLKIKAHLEERLDKARIRNDGNLTSDETARLRGRIGELKYLLDLDNDGPAINVDAGE